MPSVQDIRGHDGEEPITLFTAHDAPTAALVEAAGVEVVLVGDSIGNTVMGYDDTLPVTVEDVFRR